MSRRNRPRRLADLARLLAEPPGDRLTDPRYLSHLLQQVKDPGLVHRLATRYGTWQDFLDAHPHEVLAIGGPAALHARTRPAPPLDIPVATRLLSRYDADYPPGLLTLPTPPVLLYTTGALPAAEMLAIIGSHHATAAAIHHAQSAATSAVARTIPVVAVLDDHGVGMVALETACRLGGLPVAIIPGNVSSSHLRSELAARVRAAGGVCLSDMHPDAPWSAVHVMLSAILAVGLAHTVVACDPGLHPAGGSMAVRAAVAARRPLIVPRPADLPHSPSLGTQVLVDPTVFSPEMFGANTDMVERAAAGLPPVAYTPATPAELDADIAALFHQ